MADDLKTCKHQLIELVDSSMPTARLSELARDIVDRYIRSENRAILKQWLENRLSGISGKTGRDDPLRSEIRQAAVMQGALRALKN
jgi:hypothetical protein